MMRAPAHLEATTPESRRLYERHGFITTGSIGAIETGYPIAMTRPARAFGSVRAAFAWLPRLDSYKYGELSGHWLAHPRPNEVSVR